MVFRPYLGYFCVFHSMLGNFCFSEITWLFLGVSEYAGVISVVFKVFCGYFWWGFRVCLVISGVFRVHRGYFGGCQSMPGYFWGFQSMPGYFCIFQSMLWLFLGVSESSWLFLFFSSEYDGVFLSNGPGDPVMCKATISTVQQLLGRQDYKPVFGICLGHQLLSLAVGASTFKMKWVIHTHGSVALTCLVLVSISGAFSYSVSLSLSLPASALHLPPPLSLSF